MQSHPVLAVAVLPPETTDVRASVARLMEPYDLHKPTPPYKRYLPEQTVESLATRCGISVYDRQALAARFNDDLDKRRALNPRAYGSHLHYEADVSGVYIMDDTNPDGKYRQWSLDSLQDDVWPVWAMPRDPAPHIVITPDGVWHELFPKNWGWGRVRVEDHKERLTREAYALLDQYPDHLAARLSVLY